MRDGDVLPREFMARREDWSNGVSLYIRQQTVGVGTQTVVCSLIDCKKDEYIAPMLRLSIQEAQQLMDELWQCGLRPTEGAGSAGSLAATERHLTDMRVIALDLLKKAGLHE